MSQVFLYNSLAISATVVNDSIQKVNYLGLYKDIDKRSKHEPPNKTSESYVNFV